MTAAHVCAYLCKGCGNAGRPAAIERLEQERDELAILKADAELDLVAAEAQRDELSVLLQEEGERGGTALVERNDARTQRDKAVEAVELLLKGREWSMGFAVIAEHARTLAGLSVTEEDCTCNRDPEDGGHTPDCNRMKRDQPCERVSVCCEVPELEPTGYCRDCDGRDFKCSVHGCRWPDEGECPREEKVDRPAIKSEPRPSTDAAANSIQINPNYWPYENI